MLVVACHLKSYIVTCEKVRRVGGVYPPFNAAYELSQKISQLRGKSLTIDCNHFFSLNSSFNVPRFVREYMRFHISLK